MRGCGKRALLPAGGTGCERVRLASQTNSPVKAAGHRCARMTLVKTRLVGKTLTMPMTLDEIVEETREMPAEVVSELVDRIMAARHGGVESPVAAAWKTEIDRRIAEIEAGSVQGVPLEESLARARRIGGP